MKSLLALLLLIVTYGVFLSLLAGLVMLLLFAFGYHITYLHAMIVAFVIDLLKSFLQEGVN